MLKINGELCRRRGARALGAAASMLVACVSHAARAGAEAPAPAHEVEGSPAAAGTEAPNAAASRRGSVFVDTLGFALFGPRLGVEAGAGHVTGAAYARWFNVGLLAQSLFLNDDDEFGFSYGAGARGRYYLTEQQAGGHFGVVAEYLRTQVENRSALIVTDSAYLVPYAEAGYRLPIGSFYADASAGVGYAFQLSSKVENLPGGSSASAFEATDESSVYGTASLELGFFF